MSTISKDNIANGNGWAWGQIFGTAILTGLCSIGSIIFFNYTNKTPELVYEQFPAANFVSGVANNVSIYNTRIENAGNKEAEEVQAYFELPITYLIQEVKIEPKFKSITYSEANTPGANIKKIFFPRLNPGDSVAFSILVNRSKNTEEASELKLELRGKGITGHAERRKTNSIEVIFSRFMTFGMLIVVGLLSLFSYIKDKRMDKQMHEVRDKQICQLEANANKLRELLNNKP